MAVKLSAAELQQILEPIPDLLETLVQERDEAIAERDQLREKVAYYEKYARAAELIEEAERKGLTIAEGTDMQTKVASLVESNQDLDVLEQSIKLAGTSAPRGVFGVGDVPSGSEGSEAHVIATIMGG